MKIKGFTLLELLITVALFVGLSLIGTTSYTYFTHKNEQQTIVDELRTAIQYAKIQALTQGHTVVLTPLEDSLNWSKGMNLTVWNKRTNQRELIYQWQWNHPHWYLTWNGINSVNKITFSINLAQAISNGRFILSNNKDTKQISIILNRLGRIKVTSQ